MPPGYLLRNRYRIERRLAAGGFGETYIAIDEDYPNQRRVVVKHLKPQSNDSALLETARRLFDTEGVTLANLGDKSDRIPTLYAYFEEDREFYLVQEWIEGQTLTQELGTRKLSEAQTLEIVREILVVLCEVHSRKIVHRDLKPDNIIRRSRDRQLVLIDFGAVKAVRQTTLLATNDAQSVAIGTEGYMPSEQARGYPTSASDIYAVGAIALQCLTGKLPRTLFDQYALEWRWRHLCTVSDRVATILTKMVAERHLDRYPNAMEAIQAIDPLLAPVAPSPITPTIQSQPTPQPPAQPQQPIPPQVSLPTIKAPDPAVQAPVGKQTARLNFDKWAIWTCAGLMGLLVVSILVDRSTTPAVDPPSASQTSESTDVASIEQKLKNGDYRGALAEYDRAIELKPEDSNLYNNRGLLKHEKLEDYPGALADYDQAIKFDDNSAIAYENRGFLKHQKLDDPQGALADYDRSIKIDDNSAIAHNNRGLLKYEKLQDYSGALADYNQAIKLDEDDAITYNNRGLLKHEKLQDYQGALADYNQAIKLDSKYVLAYGGRGLLRHEKLQDYQGALADYDRAIKLDSKYVIAYSNRGLLKHEKIKNYQGALTDYNLAVEIDPKFATAYYSRSIIKYDRFSDRTGAINDMKQAASLYQKQDNKKDYQDAIEQLKKWGDK
jgi:serine/threonine protein kinase